MINQNDVLAEILNKNKVHFNLTKEGVNLESHLEDKSLCDTEGKITDQAFLAFLTQLETYKSYVDYDPRHKDAGLAIYVETENRKAWYNTSDNKWMGY